jgi:hypothetical protein
MMQGKMGAQHEAMRRVLEEIRQVASEGIAAMGGDAESPEPELEIEIKPSGAGVPPEEENEEMYG